MLFLFVCLFYNIDLCVASWAHYILLLRSILPRGKFMHLFVFVLNVPEEQTEISSLKWHSVLLFSSLFIPRFHHDASLQFCTERLNASAWLVELIFHSEYQHACTSQYTNRDIFLSSVSSLCWRLLFCLMKTSRLFVFCLMFQEASHFWVLLVIRADVQIHTHMQHETVLQASTHSCGDRILCSHPLTGLRFWLFSIPHPFVMFLDRTSLCLCYHCTG